MKNSSLWELDNEELIPVGVSSCLLGNPVRYNGGHQRDRQITGKLSDYFTYHPVCPEMAAGLGKPRPTLRLVHEHGDIRVRGAKKKEIDVTVELKAASTKLACQLPQLSGFILKKGSPSCGVFRVSVYNESGDRQKIEARGEFAHQLIQQYPWMPVEEDGRLNDPVLRENFINRVIVYRRLQKLEKMGSSLADLQNFHASHKLLVKSHSPELVAQLGRLLASPGDKDYVELIESYRILIMRAMRKPVPRKRHAMVMDRLMYILKGYVDSVDRAELGELVNSYRRGEMPLIVPVTMFRHYFRRMPENESIRQIYLEPHPDALALRNAI